MRNKSLTPISCWFLLALLFIALNMRAPFTSLSPLLDEISLSLSLSATQAGLLTTLPLIAFAFFSPFASVLARRLGLEVTIMLGLVSIAVGVMVRSLHAIPALFSGTLLLGIGIAIANVLLPGLLKRDHARHAASLTALYVLIMSVGAALGSSLVIPLARLATTVTEASVPGWSVALLWCLPLSLCAVLAWLPRLRVSRQVAPQPNSGQGIGDLLRSKVAWQITLFLGLNSFINYVFVSWFAVMALDLGFSAEKAGVYHGLMQLAGAAPALVMVPLMAKVKNVRLIAAVMIMATLVGVAGLMMMPSLALFWALLLGVGQGGAFILGLSMISLRSDSPEQATALSGMAQCLGYLLAATGPVVIGYLYEISQNWDSALTLMLGVTLVWGYCGLMACQPEPEPTESVSATA
ncbi:MFS transporter [Photobacterium sp. TY1-4]|uniref:MFS transporter n=1 Tax=Photobacterium sp. TY1-4 TaxID=2899122 RepID=UPI0021C04681|nr:MFS transporter [Photobacterium sp. TY1-4]UXI03393.1 MFS transporter [Photobacterium sp. TY1-4]